MKIPKIWEMSIENIVKKYLNAPNSYEWNYHQLSSDPNFKWEMYLANPNRPWIFSEIAKNIDWEIVICNLHIFSQLRELSLNPKITWKNIESTLEIIKWDWDLLSMHPSITWDIIKKFPRKKWNCKCVSKNPNITFQIVRENLNYDWDWREISSKPDLDPSFVYQNSYYDWNWHYVPLNWDLCQYLHSEILCMNVNLTEDIVENFVYKNGERPKWNWFNLTYAHFSFAFVIKHADKDWNWNHVWKSFKITPSQIKRFSSLIDFDLLSYNPYITDEIVQTYKDKNWNQNALKELYPFKQKLRSKDKIVKNYRISKMRKRLRILANKYRINGEIKYMPNRGIEFFKIKEELENENFFVIN